ncbi:hypothetical protein DPEC_G00089370 [Dallia pectoralis]|uniref:Uncharacterized protein n=1 Tax=Dallia pectoralis TaxID=75939 RepID=A0ACC2H1E8_DALPE|nr:hypothetical protein DPEC_G00089370 [Dallia pectoralis]
MMQAVLVTVVLGLLSVGASQAAPLTCEDLLKPMELSSFNQILGKWSSIALSSDGAGWKHLEINSAWIDVSEATPNKTIVSHPYFYGPPDNMPRLSLEPGEME